MHKICHCQNCFEGCYFVSLGRNFCFVYPSVAGSGCSGSWSFVAARNVAVVGVAVA